MMKLNKKISAFVAVFCALSFIVVSVSFYKTGILTGLNEKADTQRKTNQLKIKLSETVEGIFIDCNGLEITSYSPPGQTAVANYPEAFSHLIGYNSARCGTSGLRSLYFTDIFDGGKDNTGATIQLTINSTIQERLYGLLDGCVGSINIINAETGEIIALASRSHPQTGFNVNLIDVQCGGTEDDPVFYSDTYNQIDNFWFNRSTFAQDPPGSCAKIITATSLIENNKGDLTYNDTGSELNGEITNFNNGVYGLVDLKKAANKSINTYFAYAGLTLGGAKLKNTFNNFMVGETIELDFVTLKSNYSNDTIFSESITAKNAYGQGELIMSPLHLAMTAAAIMNDGEMMRPYVISHIENDNKTKHKGTPERLSYATDKNSAEKVKEIFHSNAYEYGLYDYFSENEVYIIAKTGTAQIKEANKGDHIYYTIGVEINGVAYGICIDEAYSHQTGASLKNKAINTIQILLDEMN